MMSDYPGRDPHTAADLGAHPGDESLVILQSLLCLLREKNILSRADIEDLCEKVAIRARLPETNPLPCCTESATAAASEMAKIGGYIGRRYGGKHRRAHN